MNGSDSTEICNNWNAIARICDDDDDDFVVVKVIDEDVRYWNRC